jgi:hypothetical protein
MLGELALACPARRAIWGHIWRFFFGSETSGFISSFAPSRLHLFEVAMHDYRVDLFLGRESFSFALNGGPLADRERVAPYTRRLGYALAAWAQLERHLDAMLIHINQERYSKILFNPDHPISLKNKLVLLRKWFNQHKALSSEQSDFRELKSRVKELSDIRNKIAHFSIDFYDLDTNTATITGFIKAEGEIKMIRTEYSIQQLDAFIDATTRLNDFLTRVQTHNQ